jgi:hypothetical protein
MSTSSKLAYGLGFQIGWFICIMAGNTASLIYCALFMIAHSIFLKKSLSKVFWLKEFLWLAMIFIFGFAIESLNFSAGFINYLQAPPNPIDHFVTPPIWLLSLWVLFGIALRTFLSVLFAKPILTYLLSTIAIPLNYYAGANLSHEIELNTPYILTLALITLTWITFLWCLIHIKPYYFEDIFNAS